MKAKRLCILKVLVVIYLTLLVAFQILHAAGYDEIDRHAVHVPESKAQSLDSLAAYLTGPAKNDAERARAIFRWIAENIAYDAEGFRTKRYGSTTPDEVLKTRSTVCAGYSRLFESLATAAGLETVTIEGYAKGFGYAPGDHLDRANHDWNAVRIDGEWRLLDATWSAGHVDYSYRFTREFDDFFFFTPPEQFIYSHFPKEPEWQLLENTISLADFEAMAFVRPFFFQNNLAAISHTQSIVQADGETMMTFRAPKDASLSATLARDGRDYPASAFCQNDLGTVYVYFCPPGPGRYELDLFVGGELAVNYTIQAGEGTEGYAEYPVQFGGFLNHRCYLYTPMQGLIKSGVNQVFKLRVPEARKVAVVMGDDWHYLKKRAGLFEAEIPIEQGKVTVYAQFPGDDVYEGLLQYEGY